MSTRIPCKNPECPNTVLPETAARNEGLCMPCVQAIAQREHDEYVRQNRRDFDAFEGVSNPLEVLKIVHAPREHDPLINWIPYHIATDQLYLQLTNDEQNRLAGHTTDLLNTGRKDEAEEIALCLAAFTNTNLEDCLWAFIARNSVWPSLIFRNASPGIRDCLVSMLEAGGSNRNHILSALAWIGDEIVVELFKGWRNELPTWRETLHIPPDGYTRVAGWELTQDGCRRNLYFQQCTLLAKGSSTLPDLFTAISERGDACPWCRSNLTNIFDFNSPHFGISAGSFEMGRIQVTCCETCSAFGTVFGFIDGVGSGHWSPKNSQPKYLPDDSENWERLPRNSLHPAKSRPPLFAADQFLPTTFSQLGGHPTWIQDAEYPDCPECSATMMFMAQLDHAEIEELSEGTYYAFICPACRTTATTYQQT